VSQLTLVYTTTQSTTAEWGSKLRAVKKKEEEDYKKRQLVSDKMKNNLPLFIVRTVPSLGLCTSDQSPI